MSLIPEKARITARRANTGLCTSKPRGSGYYWCQSRSSQLVQPPSTPFLSRTQQETYETHALAYYKHHHLVLYRFRFGDKKVRQRQVEERDGRDDGF